MRQYELRSGAEVGDLQVTLKDKDHRSEKSHAIVKRLRPALQQIGRRLGANVKLVEVPPGSCRLQSRDDGGCTVPGNCSDLPFPGRRDLPENVCRRSARAVE